MRKTLKFIWLYVLFTRQQTFLQKFFFSKFYLSKKFFLKGSKHKNGKNRYKSIQIYTIFCKIHVSTPPKIFFCWKKKFFCDRVKTKLLHVNTPLSNLIVTIFHKSGFLWVCLTTPAVVEVLWRNSELPRICKRLLATNIPDGTSSPHPTRICRRVYFVLVQTCADNSCRKSISQTVPTNISNRRLFMLNIFMQLPMAPSRRVLNADMTEDFSSSECPICTNLIGYHSATECRSYDRPKIRQKPTLWTPAFGGF